MNPVLKSVLILAAMCFCVQNSPAQTYEAEVAENFTKQLYLFPQEKIHLHIDKHDYLSGGRIWIKAYLVDAALHTPATESRYVYADLLDPLGIIVSRIKMRRDDDVFSGCIHLPEGTPEGEYVLRAYTNYMLNLDEGYRPHIPIRVNDPRSSMIDLRPRFEYVSPGKVSVTIRVADKIESSGKPESLSLTYNGKPAVTKKIADGSAAFTLSPDSGEKRQTLLLEYGNYRKYIALPAPPQDYAMWFFPEGGNLLAGVPNRVAFKALDSEGRAVEAAGRIVNESGAAVAAFTTVHEGMGSVDFTPRKDEKYYAEVQDMDGAVRRFELPGSIEGAGLKVEDGGDIFRLSVVASPGFGTDRLCVVMHTRGIPMYAREWNYPNGVAIAKDGFPSGILHILLSDPEGRVYSERLVFCNNGDGAAIAAAMPSRAGTRGSIAAELTITDSEGNPLEAGLSVSVTDARLGAAANESILSSLLLTSDLRGYVANPGRYLEKDNPESVAAADLLMLTHGWRRYEVPDVMRGEFSDPGPLPLEIGQEISGRAVRLINGRPVKDAEISIISPDTGYFDSAATDENGRFHFRHFEFPDSTRYVVQTLTKSGSSHIELLLDEDPPPPLNLTFPIPTAASGDSEAVEKYIPVPENGFSTIYLDPVTVKATPPAPLSVYAGVADRAYSEDDIREKDIRKISDLLRTTPGLIEIDGNIYNTRGHTIYGDRLPIAVFIDGVYYDPDDFLDLFGTTIDEMVHIDNVASVNIHRTAASTVILGSRAGHGAITITTKKGVDFRNTNKELFNVKYARPLSYQKPVEFYSPRYDTREKRNAKTPDRRTTVYWNPRLRSGGDGKVRFDFYAADDPATYVVIVEGLSGDGKIIRFSEQIEIAAE